MKYLRYTDGYKVYATCIVGIAAILINHFSTHQIPGVSINDADWLNNIWSMVLIMAGRSAMPDKKGTI
jgi:hypothetical protein